MSLDMSRLDSLTLARYEFRLRSLADASLPAFLGSTFRGAFGYALKAVACSMPHGECARCFLAERCLYTRVFEPTARGLQSLLPRQQSAPRPFIFRTVCPVPAGDRAGAESSPARARTRLAAGEELRFGLTLIGPAIEELPYVVYAIGLMVQHGLGVSRAPFALEDVWALGAGGFASEKIYDGDAARIRPHDASSSLGDLVRERLRQLPAGDALALRLLTPARMRVRGEVQETLGFEKLISSISLRLTLLAEMYGDAPEQADDHRELLALAREAETRAARLWRCGLERYSNRQRTKIELDGLMGEVVYAGPTVGELLPLVAAGELLHVGSGTAFGLGRYRIEAPPESGKIAEA